jgi:aerobic carbon-monoxide dehydrogenase large subunit
VNDVERAVDLGTSLAQGLCVGSCGVGASVPRREDDRFLRGRAQYVADFRMAGMLDVAFVRSPVAHARLRAVRIPEAIHGKVFVASDLAGVKPIESAPDFVAFKRSAEPILADDKLRYVGEVVAMCVAPTRAAAEDLAAEVTL